MTDFAFDDADGASLAGLFHLDREAQPLWSDGDFADILTHQLSASWESELTSLGPDRIQQFTDVTPSGRLPNTLGGLLDHPNPPVELLELIKEYAKRAGASDALPRDVAAVLYLGTICVALCRCERRISNWDDPSICAKIRWALALPWLSDRVRDWILPARAILD